MGLRGERGHLRESELQGCEVFGGQIVSVNGFPVGLLAVNLLGLISLGGDYAAEKEVVLRGSEQTAARQ